MSGTGSVRRLILQVVLLAAVLVGLSRLAGSPHRRSGTDGDRAPVAKGAPPAPPPDEMSGVPPDLTFYKTLGKERSPAAGNRSEIAPPDDETGARPRDPGAIVQGHFVVQALATRDGAAARRLRDRLAGRGFPATVSEDPSGGATVYRVRVGRYRLRSEAEAAARVLQQKDRLRPWILQEGE